MGSVHDVVPEVASRLDNLALDVAAIFGELKELSRFLISQRALFDELKSVAAELERSVESIDRSGQRADLVARSGLDEAQRSRDVVTGVVGRIQALVSGVQESQSLLQHLAAPLGDVSGMTHRIEAIATQTNLLAFNATIEAARAGDRGKGFAVVASEVKALSREVAQNTDAIEHSVARLTTSVRSLGKANESAGVTAAEVGRGIGALEEVVGDFARSATEMGSRVSEISGAASTSHAACARVIGRLSDFDRVIARTEKTIESADTRAGGVLDHCEGLMGYLVAHATTGDSALIDLAQQTAARISARFTEALATHELSASDLFDEQYQPVRGTTPQQVLTRFTAFTDRVLPPLQEPVLEQPRVVFCAAVDRNGYLPTHNLKFSLPMGDDPAWNAANCRNRRMFDDRTGLRAAKSTAPFLLQTYRRELGSAVVLMKDLSAPITVGGRHWGALRIGVSLGDVK
jgi:methyl-accepting chemotaxis protein